MSDNVTTNTGGSSQCEPDTMIIFRGWKIDLFINATGALGMTVERASPHDPIHNEDGHSRDIFVAPDTLDVTVV